MRDYILDTREEDYRLPDMLCFKEFGMPRVNVVMNKPDEKVYDWLLYMLKREMWVRIIIACTSEDDTPVWIPYEILSIDDIKDVYSRLNILVEGGIRDER